MKILILGSTGFVGKNITASLRGEFTVIETFRGEKETISNGDKIYFDLFDKDSWKNIVELQPDVIINASAYGVVKLQTDIEIMYKINYFLISELYEYIYKNCKPYWLQLGTAFEYDLSASSIQEKTPCLPKTHYGISKLMMSNYIFSHAVKKSFCILRPFGMFGKYENESKFFPYLINAQKNKTTVDLSSGTQQRDYFYVNDLGNFISYHLQNKSLGDLPCVLNIGSGKPLSFKEHASILSKVLPTYDERLWNWGKIAFRPGEPQLFYSASAKAKEYGFKMSSLEQGFKETVSYYLQFDK